MRTRIPTLFAAAALLAIGAVPPPARAQDTTVDSRWQAYLGCWEPMASAKTVLCVVPAAGTAAVDLVKIEKGEVVAAERLVATGERVATAHGDCTGWQSAAWSSIADRLYLRSENTCPSSGTRSGTGMIAMTRIGHLLYIQGATLGLETGVRVERYREASDDLVLPSEVKDALRPEITPTMQARAAATAPLSIDDVVEASRHVGAAITEAWLVERGGPFTVDAKRLIALAKAGVPTRTIDLLVALAYPSAFAVNPATGQGERRQVEKSSSAPANQVYANAAYPECSYDYLFYGYSSYYCDGMYGYGYGYYPYGNGWYPGDYPVTIIYTGSSGGSGGGGSHPHGRVVNGQGYQEGAGATSDVTRWGEPRSSTSTTSSGAAATPVSTPSTSTSSSTEQRTAKPRP